MNIYIGGGSFCHWRSDREKHWPAIVASKLNKSLQGEGYAGMGFWPVRQHILDYKNSEYFDKTDLFVFAHTNPSRMLSSKLSILPGAHQHIGITSYLSKKEQDSITRVYYKYIYDENVQQWAYDMWLTELNSLLAGKKVIHLPSCSITKRSVDSISFGAKIDISLMDIGIIEVLHNQGKSYKDWCDRNKHIIPRIPREWSYLQTNHFSDKSNNQVAQYVIDVYNDMDESTNKTYPILLDKH